MMKKIGLPVLLLLAAGLLSSLHDAPPPVRTAVENPEELGDVNWLRDLETGQKRAAREEKPLLILFQEVPGCSNCTRYGNTVLGHPLIVEAIETCFVPVCVYNNKGGKDAEALKKFNEPAWNNPVVRIVDASFKDYIPRIADFDSPASLAEGMLEVLKKTGQAQPEYLRLVHEELRAKKTGAQTATYSMYCFWTGEKTLGAIPGVLQTEAGFQDGREVVRVTYDPAQLNAGQLNAKAEAQQFQSCDAGPFRSDKEPKYYLAQTHWRFVPMTPLQAARANSLVGSKQSPESVLSPRQIALGACAAKAGPGQFDNCIGQTDLRAAWKKARKKCDMLPGK